MNLKTLKKFDKTLTPTQKEIFKLIKQRFENLERIRRAKILRGDKQILNITFK